MPFRRFNHIDYESRAALAAVLLIASGLTMLSVLLPDSWQLAAAAFTASVIIAGTILYTSARIERAVTRMGEGLDPPIGLGEDGQPDRL